MKIIENRKVSRLDKKITRFNKVCALALVAAAMVLPGCQGLFEDIYDRPDDTATTTLSGTLYIDASDWSKWHYIDLKALVDSTANDSTYDTSSAWVTMDIPYPLSNAVTQTVKPVGQDCGVYTYWYDVFGQGLSNCTFTNYIPAEAQPEPKSWTLAVHRNNARTNGCGVYATSYNDIEQIPLNRDYLNSLEYTPDTWNDNGVWINQDRMLSGYVGNQGIKVNEVLSSWLKINIPPMPPAFEIDNRVFIIAMPDGSYSAIQLKDYISATGVKCCLTINYKYPLQ